MIKGQKWRTVGGDIVTIGARNLVGRTWVKMASGDIYDVDDNGHAVGLLRYLWLRMPIIYVSGPATDNRPAFAAATEMLCKRGAYVINPLELHGVRAALAALCECEEIYMLRDWQISAQACMEHYIATTLDMTITYEV